MNRRTFLCGLTLGTLSMPLAAEAQRSGRNLSMRLRQWGHEISVGATPPQSLG